MADPQVVAADQILVLANINGMSHDELFNFAKQFLLINDLAIQFYQSLINTNETPPAPYWADTWENIQTFITNQSLMPELYTYLLTVSPPVQPLP